VTLAILVVIWYGHIAPFRPDVRTVPITLEPSPSPGRGVDFAPLEAPRPLPELRFVDGDGRSRTIADFRGRLVLLNLWATWCVPCRIEMPTLDRLQAMLGSPDFEVVALSIDRKGQPAVKAFYGELGLKALHVYVDPDAKAARVLDVLGIPTTLLVDRMGREIGRVIGPAEWDSPEVVKLLRRYQEPPSAGNERAGESGKTATEPGKTRP